MINENSQTQPTPTPSRSLAVVDQPPPQSIVNLRDFEAVWKFANMIAKTDMVPKHFKGAPEAIIVAIEWGTELGIPPMQALQNIAVINGKPAIYGELGMALVQRRAGIDLVRFDTSFDESTKTARVVIERLNPGGENIVADESFSWDDATKAGLAGRETYKSYANSMLTWRAFWRAAKRTYADLLRGMPGKEDIQDVEDMKAATVAVVNNAPPPPPPKATDKLKAELLGVPRPARGGVLRNADPVTVEVVPHEQTQAVERQPGKTTPPAEFSPVEGRVEDADAKFHRERAELKDPPPPADVADATPPDDDPPQLAPKLPLRSEIDKKVADIIADDDSHAPAWYDRECIWAFNKTYDQLSDRSAAKVLERLAAGERVANIGISTVKAAAAEVTRMAVEMELAPADLLELALDHGVDYKGGDVAKLGKPRLNALLDALREHRDMKAS